MSKEAAAHFAEAVKVTRAHYTAATNHYYDEFIKQKKTPTANDAHHLDALIKEMKSIAEAYHVAQRATLGFGGPSDTSIKSAEELLKTIEKMVAQAAAHHGGGH